MREWYWHSNSETPLFICIRFNKWINILLVDLIQGEERYKYGMEGGEAPWDVRLELLELEVLVWTHDF